MMALISRARVMDCRRLLLALALCGPLELRAQSYSDSIITPRGVCRLWAIIPGGRSWDRFSPYNRCALDRPPVPEANTRLPPSPFEGMGAHGSFTVVVNTDGTVDSSLTRAWAIGMDTVFYRRLLETMRQWRFVPGTRGGKPVRSGVSLEVMTDIRDDTLAERLEWTYRTGVLADSLVGRWVREPDAAPYAEERTDSIYVALIRRLVAMQVVVRDETRPHCLVVPSADGPRHARLSDAARRIVYGRMRSGDFAPRGCERDSRSVRLTLPDVHRTEDDRVVAYLHGDRLIEWPRDLTGESWKTWTGRCVGDAGGQGPVSIDCQVEQQWPLEKLTDETKITPIPGRSAAGSGFRLRLRITSREAYWIDTLETVVRGPLPSLDSGAVTDSEPECGARQAFSTQRAKDLLVLQGDPGRQDQFFISRAALWPTAVPDLVARSGRSAPRPAKFAAFLLGDLGARATAPITLRFWSCQRTYVLDPARHTLVRRAHARFAVRDLREQTRVGTIFGTQVFFRIDVEPAPNDVVPLVVVHDVDADRYSAWLAWPKAPGIWEYAVMRGYPPESVFSVYLIRR